MIAIKSREIMKRFVAAFFFGSAFILAVATIAIDYFDNAPEPAICPFCDQKIVDRQKIYEDDAIICLIPASPITKGHVVIAPKRHLKEFNELSDSEFIRIHHFLKPLNEKVKWLYNTDSYVLLENSGFGHPHIHYIPMKKGECHPFFKFRVRHRSLTNPFYDSPNRLGTRLEVTALREALIGLTAEDSLSSSLPGGKG